MNEIQKKDLIQKIQTLTSNGKKIIVVGNVGVGKSVLIKATKLEEYPQIRTSDELNEFVKSEYVISTIHTSRSDLINNSFNKDIVFIKI